MRAQFQIAVIRSCRLAELSRAARYTRSVAEDQSALRYALAISRIDTFRIVHSRDVATRVWPELQTDGAFPMRVKLTSHSVGWLENAVQAWLARRVQE